MISPSLKLKLETALMVFIGYFLTSIGSQVSTLSLSSVSWSLIGSLVASALGVAAHAVYSSSIPASLGSQLKGITKNQLMDGFK